MLVTAPGGGEIVAKVHAEIGDRLVIILPNGELKEVSSRGAKPSETPFKRATKDEIAAELTDSPQFKGFKKRQTNRFLYVYNTSEEFYTATSHILETMYPALFEFFKRQRIDVHNPEVPLPIIMFRTQAEFEKYRQMPQGVVAYYDVLSNRVVMYEQSRLNQVAPELAIKQSISTIAHEGVHQILHNIGVQHRLSQWPIWIAEGLPEYFAPTSVDSQIRWKGVGQVNDMRMFELERYLKQPEAGSLKGDTIRQTVTAKNLTSTGYASAWALTHFLAQRRKTQFFAYLKDVCQTGPLEDRSADDLELFTKHFGNDFGGLEQAMIKHLQGLPYTRPTIGGSPPRAGGK